MAKIDSAYNYYLSTYGNPVQSKQDSHKKSELRNVYNSMVKANKEAPLYKIVQGSNAAEFAIDMKENARHITNVIGSITGESGDIEKTFNKKVASSSNEDIVTVDFVDDENQSAASNGFEMQVKALAKPQINTGHFLDDDGHMFKEGSYSFDLDTDSNSFEFQFNVNEGDTNDDIIHKIARLVNTAKVGVSASILHDNGRSALQLTSVKTGLTEDEEYLFKISSGTSYGEIKALGIDQVSQPASNSRFTLNGHEHSSLTNNFTINNTFEVSLNSDANPNELVSISFKDNTEAIQDNLQDMIGTYNGMVAVGEKYADQKGTGTLYREITNLAYKQQEALLSIGLYIEDNGKITVDKEELEDAISNPDRQEDSFQKLNNFKDSLKAFARRTSINPMNYVNKLVVAYKNPGKSFAAPYANSAYTGMLLDGYC